MTQYKLIIVQGEQKYESCKFTDCDKEKWDLRARELNSLCGIKAEIKFADED